MGNYHIMDDDVYIHMAPACDIEGAVKSMATAVFDEYTRAGLKLHLHAKKTCAVFSLIGPGKVAAAEDIGQRVEAEGGIEFDLRGTKLVLPVAASYKHVGATTRGDGKHNTEIVMKMATMRKQTNKLRNHVLANPQICKEIRVGVVHTHILPTGEYASGAWHHITAADAVKVNRAVCDVYRQVDGSTRREPDASVTAETDAQVIADCGVMSPSHRMVYARIRTLCHIVARGRADLLTLLFAGRKAAKSW